MKRRYWFLVLAVTAIAGCASVVHWLEHRDPLLSLPAPDHELRVERSPPRSRDRRAVEHVVLHSEPAGEIGLTLSLPDPLPERNLPIVVVLGGLGTGENNIRWLSDAGDNAIIGYDWPMPVRFYDGIASLTRLPGLYRRVMTIPAQVASAVFWAGAQPWADRRRISLLGFSLGALAVPAVQHVAEQDGSTIGWTVLAYGGAPFGDLVAANSHVEPGWLRPLLAPLIDLLLRPLEPTEHLGKISGRFLVLEGERDSLIPEAARTRLRDAVPEPKTVIAFEGDHMGVGADKMDLLRQIIAESKAWLVARGAVDPF
jgi:hypothetical protein